MIKPVLVLSFFLLGLVSPNILAYFSFAHV